MATTQSGTSGSSTTRGSGSGTQGGMGRRGGRQGAPDNATYDLISVMYHTLQGWETYEQYAQDADQAGQQEIAQFFREVQQQNERLAQRGQQLLAQCLQQGQGGRSGQMHSQQNFVSGGQQLSSGMSGSGSSSGMSGSGTSGSGASSGAGTRSGGNRGGSGSV
ncbi:MAG TPA: hypothetical protein VLI21_13265 [Casimicrobiaceae bacterium]|nr:hypothetical protein [Casimicrobiaceae bacterium]